MKACARRIASFKLFPRSVEALLLRSNAEQIALLRGERSRLHRRDVGIVLNRKSLHPHYASCNFLLLAVIIRGGA